MDFDFSLIPVPFRMQPGLRRVAEGAPQLTPLAARSALYREKEAVWAAGTSRLVVPGFDPAPALAAIEAQAARQGTPAPSGTPLELAWEEDFAVIEGERGTLPWLSVCVPSHWAPEEKLGLPFAAVHAPVADAQMLLAASQQLVRLVSGGERWERFVWTLTPSSRYDQHPARHARTPWPVHLDDEALAAATCLRVERQSFLPVPGTTQSVFTIRVMIEPLAQALTTPADARRLHDGLASMTPTVLEYKNLAAARDPLLRWLATRMA